MVAPLCSFLTSDYLCWANEGHQGSTGNLGTASYSVTYLSGVGPGASSGIGATGGVGGCGPGVSRTTAAPGPGSTAQPTLTPIDLAIINAAFAPKLDNVKINLAQWTASTNFNAPIENLQKENRLGKAKVVEKYHGSRPKHQSSSKLRLRPNLVFGVGGELGHPSSNFGCFLEVDRMGLGHDVGDLGVHHTMRLGVFNIGPSFVRSILGSVSRGSRGRIRGRRGPLVAYCLRYQLTNMLFLSPEGAPCSTHNLACTVSSTSDSATRTSGTASRTSVSASSTEGTASSTLSAASTAGSPSLTSGTASQTHLSIDVAMDLVMTACGCPVSLTLGSLLLTSSRPHYHSIYASLH
ncbi:hypothetical protein BDK51DRAFT_40356 [Blyttiomyces helicus]|uniref:Uncharacterized protein n=1 Tax=Blyttiomyces helicus TaxID=388810 RepID=A0A4P9WD62_9FUNG|nr:hypothetical protein BDK51DRAFT_40356 [Blyttiomyces helicus]|eukprot:RKO88316.1 hypothetical protein BDK51DRAFT_40356 [Blyttiomyces helicus]